MSYKRVLGMKATTISRSDIWTILLRKRYPSPSAIPLWAPTNPMSTQNYTIYKSSTNLWPLTQTILYYQMPNITMATNVSVLSPHSHNRFILSNNCTLWKTAKQLSYSFHDWLIRPTFLTLSLLTSYIYIYTYIYIYITYRTANLQTLYFIYLVNKYTYWIF
jgi:hypothetical protein